MKTFVKGTRVKVTFTGTVESSTGFDLSVRRDGTSTRSYITREEADESGITIEELPSEFNPKPGEIYIISGSSGVEGVWLTLKELGVIKMASAAGVFSLKQFKDAYVGDTSWSGRWNIRKAEVK